LIQNTFIHSDPDFFKLQALVWAEQFESFILLNPNDISYPENTFEKVLAVGNQTPSDSFDIQNLSHSLFNNPNWHFGYFSFDLKNSLEELQTNHQDYFKFPELHFFTPSILIFFLPNGISILSEENPTLVFDIISRLEIPEIIPSKPVQLVPCISKENYITQVETIRNHILAGDIYEMNYCIDFYAENTFIDPLSSYLKLNHISPMPFSTYARLDGKYILCASPERFIKKSGNRIISQPIKGTIKRGKNVEEDLKLQQLLTQSEKERSENIMIVDLVRNDLSRTAMAGSVKVKELCRLYSFASVHQLISTVESIVSPEFTGLEVICNAFPMGSMTGAPKINALKLTEKYEHFRRGIYSGSIGHFTPDGDFDFNVVIRSIIYDPTIGRISCPVGSAITYYCDPEQEYQECLLKIETMRKALQ